MGPVNERQLAKVGDSCESCASFWHARGKKPRKLVAVAQKQTDNGLPIVVCPFCDGTSILRMNGDDTE